eukprot:2031434-Karenia_brevis.AAC.1
MEMMMSFDMVVIDEVGQLSMTQFERLLRLWDATERRVALIFVGDFHQLRGVDPSRANESPRWKEAVSYTHLRAHETLSDL